MDNCIANTKNILKNLGIVYTNKFVKESVLSHPYHPSILSISDTLNKYKIKNIVVKINASKLDDITVPSILQVNDNDAPWFCTVIDISKEKITYLNKENTRVAQSRTSFLNKWTGICLLVEKNGMSREPNITLKLRDKYINITLLGITGFVLVLFCLSVLSSKSIGVLALVSVLIKLLGLLTSAFLLWYEVGKHNPTLQSFCSGNKKINCNEVLNSKYAFIDGTPFTLSSISFAYFFASFINYLVFYNTSLIGILSLVGMVVGIISIYYQARILKNWCKFCLIIQGVLVVEFLLSMIQEMYLLETPLQSVFLFSICFILPIVIWNPLKTLFEENKQRNLFKQKFNKLKWHQHVFSGLLTKSQKIDTPSKSLGIYLENEASKHHVIKVCNPYCGPCAKAHPVLETLYEMGIIDLQIIFTAEPKKDSFIAKPVQHFLAIHEKHINNSKYTQKALDDWYSSEEKDYQAFAKMYPINGELDQQWNKIEAMHVWCDTNKITHTPTLYVNGYKLPNEYSIEDLQEVLI